MCGAFCWRLKELKTKCTSQLWPAEALLSYSQRLRCQWTTKNDMKFEVTCLVITPPPPPYHPLVAMVMTSFTLRRVFTLACPREHFFRDRPAPFKFWAKVCRRHIKHPEMLFDCALVSGHIRERSSSARAGFQMRWKVAACQWCLWAQKKWGANKSPSSRLVHALGMAS